MVADRVALCRVDGRRRVLVVESRAHVASGHLPIRFAELAKGLDAAGCRVEVLTAHGWVHAGEVDFGGIAVHRYGTVARMLDRVAGRLGTAGSKSSLVVRIRKRLARALRVVVMIVETRRWRRRSGDGGDVIVVSLRTSPILAAVFAGNGRWLLHQFGPPTPLRPGARGRLTRLFLRVANHAEDRRRRRGGGVLIAAPSEALRTQWVARAPFLRPIVVPIAGCRFPDAIPDARARLGVDPSVRLALIFGTPHGDKDCEVVWRAFAGLDDWRLMAAGGVADAYTSWTKAANADFDPILIHGHLDELTRDLVHAAADLVILSFRPEFRRDSATLMDAVSWGVPVVCSGRSAPAELVTEYRLGAVFDSGDATSLARAVRAAPTRIDPEDLERARRELSDHAVAARQLRALDHLGDTTQSPP